LPDGNPGIASAGDVRTHGIPAGLTVQSLFAGGHELSANAGVKSGGCLETTAHVWESKYHWPMISARVRGLAACD
jgi:hypothetical protein